MADTTVQTGTLLTSQLFDGNEQPIDMYPALFRNYPQQNPLMVIFSKLTEYEATQRRLDWVNQKQLPDTLIVTADSASGGNVVNSSQFAYVNQYDVLYNPRTKDLKLVNDTAIDSSIVVIEGIGGTTAATWLAGDTVIKIGTAYPDGALNISPSAAKNQNDYNYVREFAQWTRHSLMDMNVSTHFGGKGTKRTENNNKMWEQFKRGFEYAILYDRRGTQTVGSSTVYTFNGLEANLVNGTNYRNLNGAITEYILDDICASLASKYPDTQSLTMVASYKVINYINQICKPLIRISPEAKTYGLQLNSYFGAIRLDLVPHPLMGQTTASAKQAYIINTDYIRLPWAQKPQLLLDQTKDGGNYITDKCYGAGSLLFANEDRHVLIDNIAA